MATLFDRALRGANLAPVAGGDPAPAWIGRRQRHWEALRAWFAPTDACVARIEGLLDIARSAIIELLRVLERRWDNKRRSVSVANDFRTLAGWFTTASGEDEAQALFSAAFGLWPARHAHLLPVDGEERAPSTKWAEAAPVDVAPALRSSGSLSCRGRAARWTMPAATGAWRQRRQAEALAAHDDLRASLTTGDGSRSLVRPVAGRRLDELLDLLAAGLDAPQTEAAAGGPCHRRFGGDHPVAAHRSEPWSP